MPPRKVVTIHAPLAKGVADKILDPVIQLIEAFGFQWWLSTEDLPDLCLVVSSPQVWHDRRPSEDELAHFFTLWEAGHKDEAQAFAQKGFGRSTPRRRG